MVRTTISCTLVLMAGSALGQTGNSKGKLSPAEQMVAIKAVREYAQTYKKLLPNYTCTEITQHTARPPYAEDHPSLLTTVVEEELSIVDRIEIRKVLRIDGRPVSPEAGDQTPGGMSEGEFGYLLDIIFDPLTGAGLHWDRVTTLENRKVDVFGFHVPQSRGYVLGQSRGSIRVPFEGFVYADAQTHAVLRIQLKCTGIPVKSEYRALDLTLEYKAAQVAGQEFILPSHFVLHYYNSLDDRDHINDARFTAYRRFSAEATIQFDGDKQ
jgi:hypothetical protein